MDNTEAKYKIAGHVLAGLILAGLIAIGTFVMNVSNQIPLLSQQLAQLQKDVERVNKLLDERNYYTKEEADQMESRLMKYVDSQCYVPKFQKNFSMLEK